MRPRLGPRRRVAAVAVALTAVLVAGGTVPAAAEPPGGYAPPVDAPVADPFRPPPGPYAAGNRGIEYATRPGTEVRAAGDGEVTFAGPVGAALHVVVLHDDGLRTSYSFLASVGVHRGDRVERGAVVGTAGSSFHLGARAGERYVDPALLFGGGTASVHLVPVEERRAGSVDAERRGLIRSLADAGLVGVEALRWLRAEGVDAARAGVRVAAGTAQASVELGRAALPVLRAAVDVVAELPGRVGRAAGRVAASATVVGHALALVGATRRALDELVADQAGCTPGDRPVPPPAPGRRIVVLVGGLGSAGGQAEVLDLPTEGLGYAPADRVQFSYAGGRVPGIGSLPGVPVADYAPADTTVDLAVSGRRLRDLIAAIGVAHPGTPIDVIAHSQGGLVAREALVAPVPAGAPRPPDQIRGAEGQTGGPEPTVGGSPSAAPPVANVVTLGTPHLGTPAATIARDLGLTEGGGAAAAVGWLGGGDLDHLTGASVAQMAERSTYLEQLRTRPLPTGTAFTSIAASGDLVVPATSASLPGATNAVVALHDTSAHGRLTSAPSAVREVALALRGAGPTCVGTPALLLAVGTSAAVVGVERALGDAAAPVMAAVDGARGVALHAVASG
jgi:triacylglycerol esterase/lipase EstA (alpha/beta hydrolase family)